MSILGLTVEELANLRAYLLAAIERPCIPEWEFESLIGCSRSEARRRIECDLPRVSHDERLLDQVVALLSMLAGASQMPARMLGSRPAARGQLHELIDKLEWLADEHQAARQSSVSLRAGAEPQAEAALELAQRPARKRRG